MRLLATGALFTFALLLAACGGGGSSHIAPPLGGSSSAGSGGSSQSSQTHTTIVLRVPPASQQNSRRRPFYISPNTQSFGVYVASAGSTASPSPAQMQVFPVATPSPCASASGGGETCTLTVTAPFGNDVFYVAAFAVASPNVNSVPLSDFQSGVVNIGETPNPNATPLTFSLNGVIASVTLSVPSPDPGNTPNTQVFTAGSPAPGVPLGITAYDSSGNVILADPTIAFDPPFQLSVIPSTMGVGLTVNAQCPGSGPASHRRRDLSGSPSVNITCAADLGNVTFSYDGTVAEDSSDNVVDSAAIAITGGLASPGPSPSAAFVDLQSNVIAYPITVPADYYANNAWVTPSNGQLLYLLVNGEQTFAGSFTPSTATMSAPVQLSGVVNPNDVTVASDGSYWLIDTNSVIDCWSSFSAASNGTPTQITPPPPASDALTLTAIASDRSGNIWYTGYDNNSGLEYAGYFPSDNCAQPSSPFPTPVLLNNEPEDNSTDIVGLANGIAFQSESNGIYVVTTASSGSVNAVSPVLSGSYNGGLAIDNAQNLYAAFSNFGNGTGDIEEMAANGSSLSQLTMLPPNGDGPDPTWLAAFSPTSSGAADRLAYDESSYNVLGLVSNPTTTPYVTFETMPQPFIQTVAYSQNGRAYALYSTFTNGGEAIAGEITTTTWNVPVTTIQQGCGSGLSLLTIDERGDSGPFTVVVQGATVPAFGGMDHVFSIEPPSLGTPFTVTVTDAHGRTETYNNVVVNSGICGG